MSMISAQCDRMRERAATLRQGRWLDVEDDATLMERAADTIWELRNKLSGVVDQQDEIERLKAENTKLREERDEWHRVAKSKQDIIDHMFDARAENDKLVDVLHEVEAEAVHAYHCLQQDCVTTANSSEHYFKKWWHAECECDRLKAENAKLRESVRNLLICAKHEECEESCPYFSPAYNTYGYERYGSIVVEDEYLGCCLVGLENCNSTFFDTDEYLRELGIEANDDD